MLEQQITMNADGSGKLVITAADQASFIQLNSLCGELSTRNYMITNGPITVLPPADPPPTEG